MVLNVYWDHRDDPKKLRKHPSFAGILLQEWDAASRSLVGPRRTIFTGSHTAW